MYGPLCGRDWDFERVEWSGYLHSAIASVLQVDRVRISIPAEWYTQIQKQDGRKKQSYLFGEHGVRAKTERNHGWDLCSCVMYFMRFLLALSCIFSYSVCD